MTFIPGRPLAGGFTTDWKDTDTKCQDCGERRVQWRKWESADGAFEDYQFRCTTPWCRHGWWVDGIDS
jgi:hypothetical protein